MTKKAYKNLIKETVENKNNTTLNIIARMLFESEQAKQELRNKGYGWTGLSLLETVKQEVPNSIKRVKTFRSDCLNHNISNVPKGTDIQKPKSTDVYLLINNEKFIIDIDDTVKKVEKKIKDKWRI